MIRSGFRAWRPTALAGVLATCVLPLAGCYEHVVDARGFGTDGITIHEANLPPDADSADPDEQRAKRRQDLNELNRSVPAAPRAY